MEIFQAYFTIGMVIVIIYLTFKIVNDGVDLTIKWVKKVICEPEPNRKRAFKDVEEMFQLSEAADMFGFYDYEKPIMKHDLKNRFRKLAKQVHPDHGGNVEEFIQTKKAYDFLLARAI